MSHKLTHPQAGKAKMRDTWPFPWPRTLRQIAVFGLDGQIKDKLPHGWRMVGVFLFHASTNVRFSLQRVGISACVLSERLSLSRRSRNRLDSEKELITYGGCRSHSDSGSLRIVRSLIHDASFVLYDDLGALNSASAGRTVPFGNGKKSGRDFGSVWEVDNTVVLSLPSPCPDPWSHNASSVG